MTEDQFLHFNLFLSAQEVKEDGRTDEAAEEEEQQGSDWSVGLTFSDPAELQLEGFVLHLVMNDVDAAVRYRGWKKC